MAEIDYAFVADYARVEENGTLTTVGASYMFLGVERFPAPHRLYIAGRVRGREDEEPPVMSVTVTGPGDPPFKVSTTAQLQRSTNARPYGDGKLGYLFAMEASIVLAAPGLCEVIITLPDYDEERRLAFEAEVYRRP